MLGGDVAFEVAKLKQDLDGDVIVYASFQTVHLLIEHGLLDELRLTIFPFLLGCEPQRCERWVREPEAGWLIPDAIEIGLECMGSVQEVRAEVNLAVNGCQGGCGDESDSRGQQWPGPATGPGDCPEPLATRPSLSAQSGLSHEPGLAELVRRRD